MDELRRGFLCIISGVHQRPAYSFHMAQEIFTETTPQKIGQRIRSIRLARGLSLIKVQISSKGLLNAATLGSYERAERSLSIDRALEIAHFFRIPLAHLLQTPPVDDNFRPPLGDELRSKTVFDLRKIRSLSPRDADSEKILYFVTQLAFKRSDWNGEILTIRSSDRATIAILLRISESLVNSWLEDRNYLVKKLIKPNQI